MHYECIITSPLVHQHIKEKKRLHADYWPEYDNQEDLKEAAIATKAKMSLAGHMGLRIWFLNPKFTIYR